MNWYVKYRAEFMDDLGIIWKIHIKEKASESFDIIDFECAGTPINFSWYGSDEVFDQNINGSKMDLNIWTKEDFQLLDLFSADQVQFQTIVYQDNNLFWKGYVIPGIYQEPYDQAPLLTSIRSTDGLGLLKEYQFKDLGYEFTRQKPSVVIYDILNLVGITQFTEYINLYCEGISDGTGDSPLDQLGVDPQLYDQDNCYQALESILETFNAGIKQDLDGKFVIYRYKEITEDTMYGRKFTGGTTKTAVSKDPDQVVKRNSNFSKICNVEGGTLSMIPQASRHIINYDFGLKESVLKNFDFHYDKFELNGAWSIPEWNLYQVLIYPLSEKIPGEEVGVYLKLEFPESSLHYIYQVIENVKSRSPAWKLSFRYKLRNTSSTAKNRKIQYKIIQDAPGVTTQYWKQADGEWTTDPMFTNIFYDGDVEPGWTDWVNFETVVNGVPFSGDMEIQLWRSNHPDGDTVFISYSDVKLTMNPSVGPRDTGLGYTFLTGMNGRVLEHDRKLGDGFTSARQAVNTLLTYKGILNRWDNSDVIDPSTSWHTRGNSQDQAILELINNELGQQYVRARHLIDYPVYIDNGPDIFISQIGNLQDPVNKVNGNNRKFHICIKSFNPKTRDYDLVLTEVI